MILPLFSITYVQLRVQRLSPMLISYLSKLFQIQLQFSYITKSGLYQHGFCNTYCHILSLFMPIMNKKLHHFQQSGPARKSVLMNNVEIENKILSCLFQTIHPFTVPALSWVAGVCCKHKYDGTLPTRQNCFNHTGKIFNHYGANIKVKK